MSNAASCCASCARVPGSAGYTAFSKCRLETSTLLFVRLYGNIVHNNLFIENIKQADFPGAESRLLCDSLKSGTEIVAYRRCRTRGFFSRYWHP
jgi:hypothetical protein